MSLLVITDDLFEEHVAPRDHPERPERLAAIRRLIRENDLEFATGSIRPAQEEELRRVHGKTYLAELESTVRGQTGWLDGDTYYSPKSWDAAVAAAGAAVDVATAMLRGRDAPAIALVRPPGHHAEADRAMGFCMLNNVAIAAAAARAAGADRVAVVDWDVHHGNGTQHIFEHDPSVLFISLHQWPFYPGTGAAAEIGVGAGEGATINVALPSGCGDGDYVYAMETVVIPALRRFRPDLILVSAGFDAAASDPLAGMCVTTEGFRHLARQVQSVATEVCGGRIAAVLEGGYDLGGLSSAVVAMAKELGDSAAIATPAVPAANPTPVAKKAILATLRAHDSARNPWARPDGGSEGS